MHNNYTYASTGAHNVRAVVLPSLCKLAAFCSCGWTTNSAPHRTAPQACHQSFPQLPRRALVRMSVQPEESRDYLSCLLHRVLQSRAIDRTPPPSPVGSGGGGNAVTEPRQSTRGADRSGGRRRYTAVVPQWRQGKNQTRARAHRSNEDRMTGQSVGRLPGQYHTTTNM